MRRMMVFMRYLFFCLVVMTVVSAAHAERNISAAEYRDRLEGMWAGQLVGNYAGRQVEGRTTVSYEGANPVNKPITEYQVQWDTVLQGQYYDKTGVLCGNTSYWLGDDDTALEFLYAYSLQSKSSLTVAERAGLWSNNVSTAGLYIANKQAWYQINHHGKTAVESGSTRYNMNAGWAIDSQITTETLGALAVGRPRQASNLTGDFGGITNSGYSLHATQFYAAMYAEAPFASDVESLVTSGLQVVPTGSWTRDIVTEAKRLFDEDKAAGGLDDWLNSRNAIIDFTHQRGRDRLWVESASNTGLTTLAILYGQGSFKDTVEFGVRGGEDSDCNPATAGGLIGMMKGQTAILAELTSAGFSPALPQNYNDSATVTLSQNTWTTTEVLDIFQAGGATQVLAAGGSISDPGTGMRYYIPETAVVTGDVSDPAGAGGLVGQTLALGGQVDVVVTRNGVAMTDNSANDRTDQSRLIDGVSDLTNNGVLPFWTYDGGTDTQEDGYELHFGREIIFERLVLHEGDILPSNASMSLSRDPSTAGYEPFGGFFTDLTVEVQQEGLWVAVTNLVLSEALADLEYFQSIELTFDGIEGDAIRVVGSAGGQKPFTSMTELEAFGVDAFAYGDLLGDSDLDTNVDINDLIALAEHYGQTTSSVWAEGDFDADGDIDINDLIVLAEHYGEGVGGTITTTPEPTSIFLLACGAVSLVRRSQRRRPVAPGAIKTGSTGGDKNR